METNRSKITNDDFNSILGSCINAHPASHLLSIPGIYEILSEEFNNQVLDIWAGNENEPEIDST